MVVSPTQKAERTFTTMAWLGGIAVTLLTCACIYWAFDEKENSPQLKQQTTSEQHPTELPKTEIKKETLPPPPQPPLEPEPQH